MLQSELEGLKSYSTCNFWRRWGCERYGLPMAAGIFTKLQSKATHLTLSANKLPQNWQQRFSGSSMSSWSRQNDSSQTPKRSQLSVSQKLVSSLADVLPLTQANFQSWQRDQPPNMYILTLEGERK